MIYTWSTSIGFINGFHGSTGQLPQVHGSSQVPTLWSQPNGCFLGESRDIHLSPFIISVHQNHLWNAIYIYRFQMIPRRIHVICLWWFWYTPISLLFFLKKPRFAIDFSWNRLCRDSGNPRGQEMDSCKSSRESLILQEHTLTAQFRSTLARKKDGEIHMKLWWPWPLGWANNNGGISWL